MRRPKYITLALVAAALLASAALSWAQNNSPTRAPTTAQAVPVNPQSNLNATSQILNIGVVRWVHIGDMHITTAEQQNYADFKTIIANTNQYLNSNSWGVSHSS